MSKVIIRGLRKQRMETSMVHSSKHGEKNRWNTIHLDSWNILISLSVLVAFEKRPFVDSTNVDSGHFQLINCQVTNGNKPSLFMPYWVICRTFHSSIYIPHGGEMVIRIIKTRPTNNGNHRAAFFVLNSLKIIQKCVHFE